MQNDKPEDDPLELVTRFLRCGNFPKDRTGIQLLAQGLVKAAQLTGVSMAEITERCANESEFCPTDHDLITVGQEIRADQLREAESKRNQTAEWEREYGRPQTYDWRAEAAKIMPQTKEYWAKDRKMLALMKSKLGGRPFAKVSYPEWFRLQVWAQEQVGLPVTPEQRRELTRLNQ